MLELRPNCEFCDKDLPPASVEARICTYECTFCATCVDEVLRNVCPNCGGGFSPRPIRPATNRVKGVGLPAHPASSNRIHTPHTRDHIEGFAETLRHIPPEQR